MNIIRNEQQENEFLYSLKNKIIDNLSREYLGQNILIINFPTFTNFNFKLNRKESNRDIIVLEDISGKLNYQTKENTKDHNYNHPKENEKDFSIKKIKFNFNEDSNKYIAEEVDIEFK